MGSPSQLAKEDAPPPVQRTRSTPTCWPWRRSLEDMVTVEEGPLRAEVEDLRQANKALRKEAEAQRRLHRQALEENERLLGELRRGAACQEPNGVGRVETGSAAPTLAEQNGSEGRLRAALAGGATVEQLKQAIGGVEALLEEAKRELASKQLRRKRAALEQLHQAIENGKDAPLAEAITAARTAEVDEEDVQKAEARLAELASLTEEQRAARAAREREALLKKQAYVLVKKDSAEALLALLDGLEADVRWQEWKDYAGRSLWRCAQDQRSSLVARALLQRQAAESSGAAPFEWAEQASDPAAGLAGVKRPSLTTCAPPPRRDEDSSTSALARGARPNRAFSYRLEGEVSPSPSSSSTLGKVPRLFQAGGGSPAGPGGGTPPGAKAKASGAGGLLEPPTPPLLLHSPGRSDAECSPRSPRDGSPPRSHLGAEEEARLKRIAFRAVVQDDANGLCEVLELLSPHILASWQNKAGKDLLTLSEERGSPRVYSVLAKAYGLTRELKREAFEERETVWVYLQGEVQPRRATVLEDTPPEADEVLLEYWDGDAPADKIDRNMVRRMWS